MLRLSEHLVDSAVGYPCVLKPTDGTGSKLVQICGDRAALTRALDSARCSDRQMRGHPLSDVWLLEEYAPAPKYSAEMVFSHDAWKLLGVTAKTVTRPPFAVELRHVFPAELPPTVAAHIEIKVREWLEAIGLKFGAAHVEYKLIGEEPVLIEINPRLAGCYIIDLIYIVTGFDALEWQLRTMCALEVDTPPNIDASPNGAAIRFLTAPSAGVVSAIRGAEDAARIDGVKSVRLKQTPIRVSGTESNMDRLGHVMAVGRSPAAAREIVERAASCLTVAMHQ